jgi:predicted alpha/beta superfamily hydrolase
MRFPPFLALIGCVVLAAPAAAAEAPRPSTALPNVHVLAPALEMPGMDRSRTLRVYLPPGYARASRRYPVIYMHDGQNLFDDATAYAGEWGVDETLDALAATRGFEAIVVGIDNGGEQRMAELSPWPSKDVPKAEGEAYLGFITTIVKPFIDTIYRTEPGRRHTAIIGSSMGGLLSHYAINRRPDVFALAGVLSPSYWIAPAAFEQARETALPPDARIYLYAGGREGDSMVQEASRMDDLLRLRMGADGRVLLDVVDAAEHNEAAWRAAFPRVVAWLFAIPPVAAGGNGTPPGGSMRAPDAD